MPDADLPALTLIEVSELLRTRALSPVELARAVMARIEALNPRLNAFTTVAPMEDVLAAAQIAETEIGQGAWRGPLHGVPVGVKDLIDTAGLRTTYGSGAFREHVPSRDGAAPERLKAAGAVITGKTATHELGGGITTNNYFYGPTRNPWNPEHVPGGSSGGAAAAAAACMGSLQVGTDGAGSVRFPAAWCGVVGHKPTLGLISNRGQFGDGNTSYSVPGPLARTVRDAALASQLLAGFDTDYVFSRPNPVPDLLVDLESGVRDLRIGFSPDLLKPAPEAEVRAAYDATLRRLERLGAKLVEITMPHHGLVPRGVMAAFGIEGEVHLHKLFGDRPRLLSPQAERVRPAAPPSDPALWVKSQHDRQRIGRDYAVAFTTVDVIIQPVAPFVAPRIDDDETPSLLRAVGYTGAANLVGFPSVSLPAGLSRAGLPLAIQIMAAIGNDAMSLRVAWALEQDAAEHRVARPPIS